MHLVEADQLMRIYVLSFKEPFCYKCGQHVVDAADS